VRDGDERCRDERARDTADAVAPVQQAEHERAVVQPAAEGIAHGDVDGDAEADEEEGEDDEHERRRRHERYVRERHHGLAQAQEPRPAELGAQRVE